MDTWPFATSRTTKGKYSRSRSWTTHGRSARRGPRRWMRSRNNRHKGDPVHPHPGWRASKSPPQESEECMSISPRRIVSSNKALAVLSSWALILLAPVVFAVAVLAVAWVVQEVLSLILVPGRIFVGCQRCGGTEGGGTFQEKTPAALLAVFIL